ncbi:MAG: DUF3575 domain-containing protein [Muribaculaceae bacterium]|nr:DUF3575 domain-containing protein [Muribaculaceae bacterium]
MKLTPVLIVLLMLGSSFGSVAGVRTDSVSIGFHRSHINIDTAYASNGEHLDSIFNKLSGSPSDGQHRLLRQVRVMGGASPEGSVRFNEYLSEKRANVLLQLFREKGIITDSTITSKTYLGRDWKGLRRGVEEDENVPYREEVLSFLEEIPETGNAPGVPHPLEHLKAIGGGRPYRYIDSHIFPGLRKSVLLLEYDEISGTIVPDPSIPEIGSGIGNVHPGTPIVTEPEEWTVCKPFYMGLKTNMIYDLLALPNIGAEFYIGKNWSLTADWIYGWWDKDPAHRYWRAYGGYAGARRWFGKKATEKPLTGHHLGIFAGAITYDFEFGGEGIMGGKPHGTLWERCNFISGIEYGYSLPVARRLNLDFSIALGYIGGKYYKYIPYNGFYLWQSTHKLNYFGPTKIEVSLVWLIGCRNFNERGGRK